MRRLVLAVLLTLATAAAAEEVVSISDLHFNPFYDPSLMAKLAATDVSGWAAVFASSTITTPSTYGADTNYPLLRSFLDDLKVRSKDAHFVVISGDFLSHHFPQAYQQAFPNASKADYQSFITQTVQFVANEIKAATHNKPIFPVLGNNDSDCGDYMITPNGWFLPMFAKAWASSVGSSTFVKQFTPAGWYSVSAPIHKTTIIGLNSVLFSMNYDNACGTGTTDYGAQQLTWLEKQLAAAQRKRHRVWLLYHIPPGINVYSTIEGGAKCPTPVLMWKSQYTATFNALMQKYASTIPVSLAGHTHMDDFRVMGTTTSPYAYIHITPAISPLFSNNPAYETLTYTPDDAKLADYTVFYLGTQWTTEYSFRTAYQQPAYNPETVNDVRNKIGSDAATRALYMKYYTASNATSTTITPQNWFGYWCGTGAPAANAFTACYCVTPQR